MILANFIIITNIIHAETATECTIALNELMPNPSGTDSGNEWLELYNCTEAEVLLEGWVLSDKSGNYDLLENVFIEPMGYFLIHPSFSINQSNEEIYLFDENRELIDFFSYESSSEDTPWAREFDGIGEWTDGLVSTPESTNYIEYPTEIRINEIYPSPDRTKDEFEWIELYNFSSEKIDLNNWVISDLTRTQILQDITIDPDEYSILYESILDISLNNSGDIITLFNPTGEAISTFQYGSTKVSTSNILDKGVIKQSQSPTPYGTNLYTDSVNLIYESQSASTKGIESISRDLNYQSPEGIPIYIVPHIDRGLFDIPSSTTIQDKLENLAITKQYNSQNLHRYIGASGFFSSISSIILLSIKRVGYVY